MTFEIVTEPIAEWPLPDTKPRSAIQFTASHRDTMRSLRLELQELGAVGPVVIQVVTRNGAKDLRLNGELRTVTQITHPGVRVSFESKHGPLTYATDEFEARYDRDMPSWQANLRALTLGLEALRRVDRYGISKTGEQYRGWLAIEAPAVGIADARATLVKYAELDADDDNLAAVWRIAKSKTHPDLNNGDQTHWDVVQGAAKALGLLS